MPDTTPEQILARAQVPPTNGRPVRKDEIELDERGIYIESWLPERRSRRKPLLFVHGELAGSWVWERYLGYFAGARLGGSRPQPAQPLLVADRRPGDALVRHLHRGRRRARSSGSAPNVVVVGHGMGGLLALKAAERMPISGLVLLSSELPRELRVPARRARAARDPRGLRQGAHRLGDAPRAPAARRSRPDPGRRPAHPAPARAEAARGRRRPAPDARPACRSIGAGCRETPRLVIGGRPGPGRHAGRIRAAGRVARRGATSRSARTRTTGWSSARAATSRSPSRSAGSSRPTGSRPLAAPRLMGPRPRWYHADRPGEHARDRRGRIRLEAQDTALSRRRSPVRIRYAVPTSQSPDRASDRAPGRSHVEDAGEPMPRSRCELGQAGRRARSLASSDVATARAIPPRCRAPEPTQATMQGRDGPPSAEPAWKPPQRPERSPRWADPRRTADAGLPAAGHRRSVGGS